VGVPVLVTDSAEVWLMHTSLPPLFS
jgi:hypothetical protein